MDKSEPTILSMIIWPAVVSNLVTIVRLALELAGMGDGKGGPKDVLWWIGLWPLILLSGIYFGYLLQHSQKPYRRLLLTLLAYAFSVRVVTAVLYGISGSLGWKTHYSVWGGGGYLGAVIGQLGVWPILTLIFGSLTGMPTLALLRSGRKTTPASA
jgi:hypothetical protein